MKQIIDYIQEREKSLARYSDKLRQAVTAIANVFGSKRYCRICNSSFDSYGHAPYFNRYTHVGAKSPEEAFSKYHPSDVDGFKVVPPDYLPGHWKDGNKLLITKVPDEDLHEPIPKIEVSINIEDEEAFYYDEETDEAYYLAFSTEMNHSLVAHIRDVDDPNNYKPRHLKDLKREALKELIKSGRLTAFLSLVAETLKKKDEEYREVSEIAEKMAEAVRV